MASRRPATPGVVSRTEPVITLRPDALRAGVQADKLLRVPSSQEPVWVQVENAWICAPLDAWTVAYRLVPQAGVPVVAEVRIYPTESPREWIGPDIVRLPSHLRLKYPRAPPGEWSGTLLGIRAEVPRGGLTARTLRKVRLGADVFAAKGLADWWKRLAPWGFSRDPGKRRDKQRRRGRPGQPLRFYAEVAREYVRAMQRREPPLRAISTLRGWKLSHTRDRVRRARVLGLLTGGGKSGRARGQLTPLALRILMERRTRGQPQG
jgi:hypothetical protein